VTLALEGRDLQLWIGGRRGEGATVGVGEWEIVGVVGTTGAGKTTLLDVLSGIVQPRRGQVLLRGVDVTALRAYERAALGMARTFERPGAIPALTVMDNVLLAQHGHVRYGWLGGMWGWPGTFFEERELARNGEEILDFLGMWDLRAVPVAELPRKAQRRCDLAMALATDPTLLLMDEPSSGLEPPEVNDLAGELSALRSELNLTILLAEHHLPLVADTCDFAYAMSAGRLVARGDPSEIARHPALVASYTGEPTSPEEAGATA
jgi:branched-chain amino acid transport system ATP-binding protein